MARPAPAIPKVRLQLHLPAEIDAKMRLHLHSELEGRVPQGEISEFIYRVLREYFDSTRVDLAPFLSSQPGALIISGPHHVVQSLTNHLKGNAK